MTTCTMCTMSSRRVCWALAVLCSLAVVQGAAAAKVTFPDSPAARSAPDSAPAAPESRLLADAAGGFGLTGTPAAASGQTRNLAGASVFDQARRRPDCPECHPSVYSYCGDRLLHDACCCLRDTQPLPPQCNLADCSFLHSKSCYEHNLITRCCCDRRLF